jgi:hypothetical protein
MIDDPMVSALADRNPVRDLPKYDDAAERTLHRLLNDVSPIRRHRAAPRWAAAVGVGVVAAVAVGVVVANQRGGESEPKANAAEAAKPATSSSAAASGATTTRRFPTADASTPIQLVVDRTAAAVNSASDYVLEAQEIQRSTSGEQLGGLSISWQDQGDPELSRIEEDGTSGQPLLDESMYRKDGTVFDRAIDYRQREWAEVVHRSKVPMPSQTQGIVQDIQEGHDRVLGTDTINGRLALHLGNDEPGMGREIWVDPSTYLPIRMTEHGSFGTAVLDYTWIPKSDPSTAGIFLLQPPPGFVQVPKIKG